MPQWGGSYSTLRCEEQLLVPPRPTGTAGHCSIRMELRLLRKTFMNPAGTGEGVYFSVSSYNGSNPPFNSPVMRAFDQKRATQKRKNLGSDLGFVEIMPPYVPLYYCVKE